MFKSGKLRVTAAKVEVTVAFLALLAGVAEIGRGPARVVVTPVAAVTQPSAPLGLKGANGLKLKGLSPVLKADFTAIARALSSFTAVSRLMEEQGIFYFFKHTDGGTRS